MENSINYDSSSSINNFLSMLNIAPQKRFGQNFLINRGAREKIVTALDLTTSDELWEIGPGLGAMTAMVLEYDITIKVFEIDKAYQAILDNLYGQRSSFSLVRGDVLKTWPIELTSKPIKVLGNLPYNIAAAVIQLLWEKPILRAVITVQKEMAERMMSLTRRKEYSSFSVWCQSHFDFKHLGNLKPGSFYPAPRVDSSILMMTKKEGIDKKLDNLLQILTKAAFANRRKTIKNNWLSLPDQYIDLQINYSDIVIAMNSVGVTEQMRAEEIEVVQYIKIAKNLLK